MSWEKVTKTKQQGGLGIRDIKLNNEAFLTNQAWRIWTNPNGIWAKFLKQRHFPNTHFLNPTISNYGSHSWKAIPKGRSILSKETRWIVRNGQSTNFWTDPWLLNSTLWSLIHGPLMPWEDNTKVSYVLAPNSQWNLNPLSFELPISIIKQIQATPLSNFNVTQDKLIWLSYAGIFLVKLAYIFLSKQAQNKTQVPNLSWSYIWKIPIPPKIKIFLWKCAQNRVPSRAFIFKYANPAAQACPRYGLQETTIHLLWDYSFLRDLWLTFSSYHPTPNFFDVPIHQWCKTNTNANITINNILWYILFPFILWSIWLSCNSLVFNNKYITLSQLRKTGIHHATEFFYLSMHPKLQHQTISTTFIGWKPTPFPFLTLNIDGSSKGNTGHAGAGRIIRNHWGKWIGGFSINIGITHCMMAKLWAIWQGLKYAWNNGYKYINLQVDSKLAHNWITNLNSFYPLEYSNLIHDCRSLLERPWVVKTNHIWREANGCVDLLAKKGADQFEREIFYDTCPAFLMQCYF